MNPFQFSLDPPPLWEQSCIAHRALFHSPAWQHLMEKAFDTVSVYGWHAAAQTGLAISVFRAGPFFVGYLGFPVGGFVGSAPNQSSTIEKWCRTSFPVRIDCLRIPVSGFSTAGALSLPATENPETAIVDLSTWDPDRIAKLRRDLNKARRSPIVVEPTTDPALAPAFERLYRMTVVRHRGQIRYHERYFRLLLELSSHQPAIRCLVARCGADIAGFNIIALHCGMAYYLHGASNPRFVHHGASDLLLHDAIIWAKRQAARSFNLMASPPGQPSLVRYKEKWDGITKIHKTYTLPISIPRTRLIEIGERVCRAMRR